LQILNGRPLIQCRLQYNIILIVIIVVIIFSALYIIILYQNQLQVLGQAKWLIPLIPGGVGALKIFYDLRKELALKFDGTSSRDVHYVRYGNLVTKLYCLRVKKKGVGGAENCEAQIKVDGMGSDYFRTQWYNEQDPSPLITMDEKYLKLFEVIEIDNQKKIRFYSVSPPGAPEIPYNEENINRKISAKIGSKNARVPHSAYSKKISEIIDNT
jgi:hypothetical protein